MAVGAVVIFGLGELDNIRNLDIAELHALDGVAVAGFAVAQSGFAAAQNIVHAGLVEYSGGHIGGIPHAVFFGIGQIVLVDGQGAGSGFIDGSVLQFGGGDSDGETEQHGQSQQQGENLGNVFHFAFSFHS